MEQLNWGVGTRYVALYRVSKSDGSQVTSLVTQKDGVNYFVDSTYGSLVGEFTEQISSRNSNREILNRVIALCKEEGATLLVYKLDRIGRGGIELLYKLQRARINYFEVISPYDNEFLKGLKILQAKQNNEDRTGHIQRGLDGVKKNLKEKKFHISKTGRRLTKLGTPENLTQKSRDRSIEVRKNNARDNKNNLRALTVLKLLLSKDITLQAMADYLNAHEFETSRGSDFTPTSVSNVLKLYGLKKEKQRLTI